MSGDLPRVVLHQDDVGMCHGANTAFVELFRRGTITSGSVMVPCPWLREIADLAADHTFDLGVHLTLTAEKRHYKWGPLTRPGKSSGLVDADGYFHPDVSTVRRLAHPEAVEAELRAQLELALCAGIDVTHLDAHMGAAIAPEFCDAYIRLGVEHRVPVLLTRDIAGYAPNNHLVGVDAATHEVSVSRAAAAGLPLFDRVLETDWRRTGAALDTCTTLVESCVEPLTFICLHPNAPGELQFIEPDSAYIREDEYAVLGSPGFHRWLDDQPIAPIGMRTICTEFRANLDSTANA
jgi:predicted glycoside hydrolase/deacetylase ChbG (UPF0249 family)